jgi:hypothetical protein
MSTEPHIRVGLLAELCGHEELETVTRSSRLSLF